MLETFWVADLPPLHAEMSLRGWFATSLQHWAWIMESPTFLICLAKRATPDQCFCTRATDTHCAGACTPVCGAGQFWGQGHLGALLWGGCNRWGPGTAQALGHPEPGICPGASLGAQPSCFGLQPERPQLGVPVSPGTHPKTGLLLVPFVLHATTVHRSSTQWCFCFQLTFKLSWLSKFLSCYMPGTLQIWHSILPPVQWVRWSSSAKKFAFCLCLMCWSLDSNCSLLLAVWQVEYFSEVLLQESCNYGRITLFFFLKNSGNYKLW